MPPPADSAAILFPGALGDFVCFLPTLCALRERHAGQLLLVAKSELLDLVEMPGLAAASIDRREIADVFVAGGAIAPATAALLGGFASVYSWTGFGNANFLQRLGVASRGAVGVYAFRGMRPAERAIDYYAHCVGVTPRSVVAARIRQDRDWLAACTRQRLDGQPTLVLHSGSGSPSKNWQGFRSLTRYWSEHHAHVVVVLSGPAEARSDSQTNAGVVALDGLSLPQVAALLAACDLYVGNDSGVSHLAGAVGARGVVLFGPTDPTAWAPRCARLQVIHAPTPCSDCAPGAFCVHRLPVDAVIDALQPLSVQP